MILYINACVRRESRTNRIANALLDRLGREEVVELKLTELGLKPLTEDVLDLRTELIHKGDFSHPMFDYAKQFAAADAIVIAAPYWDGSFPALLKDYIENIFVTRLVSRYDEQGMPHGLCRAKMLYYVTTAGGPYVPTFGYDYISALAKQCFGVQETALIKAEMLDVVGFDAEQLVQDAIDSLDVCLKTE